MIFVSDYSSPFPYYMKNNITQFLTKIRHGLDRCPILSHEMVVDYCGKSITRLSSGIIVITKQDKTYILKCERV
jgi:hypothetical protein